VKALVTGAAGFIGSTLADRLLGRGDEVVGYDNFSTGNRQFLADALKNPRFRLVEGDVLDGDTLAAALRGVDIAIARNEYVAIMGPSGSGKSTLMNIIGCLDTPNAGEYWLNGQMVSTMSDDALARELGAMGLL